VSRLTKEGVSMTLSCQTAFTKDPELAQSWRWVVTFSVESDKPPWHFLAESSI